MQAAAAREWRREPDQAPGVYHSDGTNRSGDWWAPGGLRPGHRGLRMGVDAEGEIQLPRVVGGPVPRAGGGAAAVRVRVDRADRMEPIPVRGERESWERRLRANAARRDEGSRRNPVDFAAGHREVRMDGPLQTGPEGAGFAAAGGRCRAPA